MRPATRLFQTAAQALSNITPKGTARQVAFHPTGIAGVLTHPHPRPTLLNIYNSTLLSLSKLPSDSSYRHATEALINHRKKIVEAQLPAGWELYLSDLTRRGLDSPPKYDDGVETLEIQGRQIQAYWGDWEDCKPDDHDFVELGKENAAIEEAELNRQYEEKFGKKPPIFEGAGEPQLSVEQVEAIEQGIGGGLIEEVIDQAYEELKLVEVMAEAKVWEPLVEQPVEGQWTYFETSKP